MRRVKQEQVPHNQSIIYSQTEWSRLHSYLSENQRFEESVDRKRQELADRKEVSKKLKETFVGSKDEEKIQLKRKRDKEKYEKDSKKNEEQKKRENSKIIEQTKMALMRNKDGWKALDSALRLADTLRERRKQLEFQEKMEQVEKAIEKEYADKIFQNAREFQEETLREKQEKFLRKNEKFERATQSLKQIWEERDRIRKIQIEEEVEEFARIKREMKAIQDTEMTKKEESKKMVEKIAQESWQLEKKKKEKEKVEEELDKASLHVIKQTTLEITDMKNKVMQERHNAEAAKRERSQQHLAAIMKAEEDHEEERLKNDLVKAEQRYKEKEQLESDRKARIAKEKNSNFVEYVRNIEEQERAEKETRQREMMKRLIMNEHDKVETEKKREMNRDRKRLQRQDLDRQMEELKFYTREARQVDHEAVQRSALLWKMDDQEVLKYGDKVLRDCKDKDRPTLPVLEALHNFKKTNRLTAPREKNLSQWESNVMPKPFRYNCTNQCNKIRVSK